MDVTRALAEYLVRASYAELPNAVVTEAKRSCLNWLGVTVGGCRHEAVETALAAVTEFSGPARASVLGRRERLDILHTALINGISSHVLDFDDTHHRNLVHPSGHVAAAILALAEQMPTISGREFLNAFVLGVEAECRVGNAVWPSHYDAGWHITGTAGVIGAAAAAGKLLGLDSQRMTWALGIAATQAAGFREVFGTMCKPFHVGRAAQNGLMAALLARKGFTSSERAIEGSRGFTHVLATARDLAAITAGLGGRYEILDNTYKPFACGLVIHPAIDGCIQLRNEHALSADLIEQVDLKVHPLVLELTGKRTPVTGLEGKFSVFHSAAVALIDGMAGEAQYSDARVRDPQVLALRERVRTEIDPTVTKDEVKVTIRLRDGRIMSKHVAEVIGSVNRPMTDSDLEAKFRALAAPILAHGQVATLVDLCWNLEQVDDVSKVALASVPA